MNRDVPYDEDAKCDDCGNMGAYDFMGDYICEECVAKYDDDEEEATP